MRTSGKNRDHLRITLGLFVGLLCALEFTTRYADRDELTEILAANDSDIPTLRDQLATATDSQGQPFPDDVTERVNNLLADPLLASVEPGVDHGAGGGSVRNVAEQGMFDNGVAAAHAGQTLNEGANEHFRAGFFSVKPEQPTDLETGKPVPTGAYASASTGGLTPAAPPPQGADLTFRPGAGSVAANPGSGFGVGDPAGAPAPVEPVAHVDTAPAPSAPLTPRDPGV